MVHGIRTRNAGGRISLDNTDRQLVIVDEGINSVGSLLQDQGTLVYPDGMRRATLPSGFSQTQEFYAIRPASNVANGTYIVCGLFGYGESLSSYVHRVYTDLPQFDWMRLGFAADVEGTTGFGLKFDTLTFSRKRTNLTQIVTGVGASRSEVQSVHSRRQYAVVFPLAGNRTRYNSGTGTVVFEGLGYRITVNGNSISYQLAWVSPFILEFFGFSVTGPIDGSIRESGILCRQPHAGDAGDYGLRIRNSAGDVVFSSGSETVRISGSSALAGTQLNVAGWSPDTVGSWWAVHPSIPASLGNVVVPVGCATVGSGARFNYAAILAGGRITYGLSTGTQTSVVSGGLPVTTVSVDAGDDLTVASGGTVDLSGSAIVNNPVGDTVYAWTRESGAGGTLSGSAVVDPTFTAPAVTEETVIEWRLRATNNSVFDEDVVAITVEPAEGAAIDVENASLTIDEGGTGTIRARLTTEPTGNVTMSATESDDDISVSPATRTFTTLNWNTYQDFTVTGEQDTDTVDDTATVTLSTAGGGYGDVDNVDVIIEIADDESTIVVANAGFNKTVASGGSVVLSGSAVVVNGVGETTYAWARDSGTGGSLSASNVAQPTFNAPTLAAGASDVTIVYELTVTNNSVSNSDTVTITVEAPEVVAFSVSISGPSTLTISTFTIYTATVVGGMAPYTYSWSENIFGFLVSGSSTGMTASYFAGTQSAGLSGQITCEVTDANDNSVTATKTVSINPATPASTTVTANAGSNKTVASGGSVVLSGSAVVVNGVGATTYSWSRSSGTGGSLSGSNTAQPTFNAPTLAAGASDVTIVYQLTATNNSVSDSDTVTITVQAPQTAALSASISGPSTFATSTFATYTVTATGGTSPYSYSWSENIFGFVISGSTTGRTVSCFCRKSIPRS